MVSWICMCLYRNCSALHQRPGKAMRMRTSGAQHIHISASYFQAQPAPTPVSFCCHTIRWEQNLLAQLLESNCKLITCAGMWVGMLSTRRGALERSHLENIPLAHRSTIQQQEFLQIYSHSNSKATFCCYTRQ